MHCIVLVLPNPNPNRTLTVVCYLSLNHCLLWALNSLDSVGTLQQAFLFVDYTLSHPHFLPYVHLIQLNVWIIDLLVGSAY